MFRKRIIKIVLAVIMVIGAAFFLSYMIFYNPSYSYSEVYNKYYKNLKDIDLAKGLTAEQKLEDFEYLYNTLQKNFPFFEMGKRKTGFDWLSHKEEFEKRIRETKNNVEFYNEIKRMVTLLQVAHARLVSPELFEKFQKAFNEVVKSEEKQLDPLTNSIIIKNYEYWKQTIKETTYILPIVFSYIEGKYVAIPYNKNESLEEYGVPEGSILLKVNELAADEYAKSLMDKAFLNYDFKRNKIVKYKLYVFADSLEDTIKLTFLSPKGEEIEKTLQPIEVKINQSMLDNKLPLVKGMLVKGKVAYLKIPEMKMSQNDIKKDGKEIYSFFKEIKDYPYLIIDIRGNGGGNVMYWIENIVKPLTDKKIAYKAYTVVKNYDIKYTKTLDKLPKGKNYPPELKDDFGYFAEISYTVTPKNYVGFKGKIYLLTDAGVYSAAEGFASFAKATKWATVVGTPTSGGLGFNPDLLVLPNSGLIIRYPNNMALNPDGTANEEVGTQPDIYVEESYDDFVNYLKDREKIDENNILDMVKYDTVLKRILEMVR
ncbi:C-terminal processing protease CtpA/Prc [Caldanaerobacter subterraneus subsp. tengcongensis MB4]|uniref:Periplasmic protease n=1 Tax=Caldanaerobacter subterraneus subsp. tengcongensis (strain DSM 15242 / JCM 11007 / NBRC 100824 / MB4) TaxID=273068 RepID=Q8R7P6_CALS4|nr:S41 family peptidase [Caldanaerobacter subterraneus]AAM25495.1 Periplasmic protease [Caldanaerobacter subterraneus subsp. tengcongensis MB4]MCS3914898.1 C-terminal processing protease CtpA/Prc [Caldanaerobacter subterraneus subsp. tengcongensis MB4]